jgi:hypothetical protein
MSVLSKPHGLPPGSCFATIEFEKTLAGCLFGQKAQTPLALGYIYFFTGTCMLLDQQSQSLGLKEFLWMPGRLIVWPSGLLSLNLSSTRDYDLQNLT